MTLVPTRDLARGRWGEILPALGVPMQVLNGKHQPCPRCRGTDRFRYTDREGSGSFICTQCGSGDGFKLAEMAAGVPFKEACATIEKMFSSPSTAPLTRSTGQSDAKQRKAMQRVWSDAGPFWEQSPVGLYLMRRVGRVWRSNSIREAYKVWHPDAQTTTPAMVCCVVDPAGKPVNLHLTYLTADGRKAEVVPNRRIMPGSLPEGSAVRLGPIQALMGVAEGVETAIAASILFGMPVWATLNAGRLSKWLPPEGCAQVAIFADNDENFTGAASAYALANRLTSQLGRRARVFMPKTVGQDWCDVLVQRLNSDPSRATAHDAERMSRALR